MRYRTLGKTGLQVSEIGFGGEWLNRHEPEEAANLIRHARELGINILDCWMNDAESRDRIGLGIAGHREDWFIQGHLGSTLKDGQYYRTRELSYVIPAFEDLLKRLGTNYIDLGMIHYVDSEKEWEELQSSEYLKYVFELKEKGVIRHIGLSSHNPRVAMKAARSGYVEMLLFSINPAFDLMPSGENLDDLFEKPDESLHGMNPERAELYSVCEQNNVGITVMKGFAGGRLFKKESSAFGVELTAAQCIHYALTRPAVASILCGYDSMEQIDEAVAYETASEKEKDYATVLSGAPMHAFLGKCMYCNHCKPCPADIDIAMVNKLYDLAMMQPEVPESLREHYHAMEHNADECIGCGGCETRCPFRVPVADRMRKARELFQ